MTEFKKYRRTQIAEMRQITEQDVTHFKMFGHLDCFDRTQKKTKVSISQPDLQNGSPKVGDMIARNPKNHNDQWLVAKQYFQDNFSDV